MTRKVLTPEDRLVEQYEVTRHWNLVSYTECSKCKVRYVREWGWRFNKMSFFDNFSLYDHICGQCCSSAGEAATWAKDLEVVRREERHEMFRKMVKPPPPPMRAIKDL